MPGAKEQFDSGRTSQYSSQAPGGGLAVRDCGVLGCERTKSAAAIAEEELLLGLTHQAAHLIKIDNIQPARIVSGYVARILSFNKRLEFNLPFCDASVTPIQEASI